MPSISGEGNGGDTLDDGGLVRGHSGHPSCERGVGGNGGEGSGGGNGGVEGRGWREGEGSSGGGGVRGDGTGGAAVGVPKPPGADGSRLVKDGVGAAVGGVGRLVVGRAGGSVTSIVGTLAPGHVIGAVVNDMPRFATGTGGAPIVVGSGVEADNWDVVAD